MAEKLEFDLVASRNNLAKNIDDSTKKAKKLEGALTVAAGVFVGNVATKAFQLFGDAIGGVVGKLGESIDASAQQQDAINRLNNALRTSGDFTQQASDEFQRFASEIQQVTKFGDELVLGQIAIAKSFGATNEQAKEIVTAATDLSAALDISLDSAVRNIAKTLGGFSGELGEAIPQLKELGAEALQAGQGIAFIGDRFSGAAQRDVQTYTGANQQLSNAFGDLLEKVGDYVVQSPQIIETIKQATTAVNTFNESLDGQSTVLTSVIGFVGDYIEVYSNLAASIIKTESPIEKVNSQIIEQSELIDDLKAAVDRASGDQGLFGFLITDEAQQAQIAKASSLLQQAEQDLTNLVNKRNELSSAGSQERELASLRNAQEEFNKVEEAKALKAQQVADKILESRVKLENEISLLEAEKQIKEQERVLSQTDLLDERREIELEKLREFEQRKLEVENEIAEQRVAQVENNELKTLEARKAAIQLGVKQTEQRNKQEKRLSDERLAIERANQSQLVGLIGTTSNALSAITKEGSREQFAVRQATALANAVIATNLAIAQANAVPPPANIAAIAAAKAQGAIAISGIVAQSLKGFQEGGFIGGVNGGTIGGDTTTVNARDGELVLNADDQRELLGRLRNQSDQPIVIQIDGREIARAVRNEIEGGFVLA